MVKGSLFFNVFGYICAKTKCCRPVARVLKRGVRIFPWTIVIEQQSGVAVGEGGVVPFLQSGVWRSPSRKFWKWKVKSCILVAFYLNSETEVIEHFYMKIHIHGLYSVTDRHEYDITYMYSPLPFFNNHLFRSVTEIHHFIRCLTQHQHARTHFIYIYICNKKCIECKINNKNGIQYHYLLESWNIDKIGVFYHSNILPFINRAN